MSLKKNEKKTWVILITIYGVITFSLLSYYGVLLSGDSNRYLEGAKKIANLLPFEEKQSSYLGYIVYVFFIKELLGYSNYILILGQWVFSLIAISLTIWVLLKHFGIKVTAIAVILISFNQDIHQWNSWVLTDSLYTWGLTWLTLLVYLGMTHSFKYLILAGLGLVCLLFLRPTAFCLIPLIPLIFLVFGRGVRVPLFTFYILALILLIWGISNQHLDGPFIQERLYENLRRGTVLWNYEKWSVLMPYAENQQEGALAYFSYIWEHPIACVKLFGYRTFYFFWPAREYFSSLHNWVSIIWYIPVTVGAIVAIVKGYKDKMIRICFFILLMHVGLAVATFIVQDNRWLAHVSPIMAILASMNVVLWKKDF